MPSCFRTVTLIGLSIALLSCASASTNLSSKEASAESKSDLLSSIPEVESALRDAEKAIATIVSIPDGTRTFENTVLAVDDMWAELWKATDMMTFMSVVSPDEALRNLGETAQVEIEAWAIGVGKREDVYQAIQAFAKNGTAPAGEGARLLEVYLRDYRRAGMELDMESRGRLTEVELELSKLELDFQKNIRQEDEIVLLSREELPGLPSSWFEGVKESEGLFMVTLDNPTYSPIMRYCEDQMTRRKLYVARRRRAGGNVKLIEEILLLRAEQAALLGYKHAADFETEVKMTGSADVVQAFYEELRPKLRVKAEIDYAEYQDAKREHLGDPEARLEHWDQSFYHNRLLKEKYAVDQEKVREYFSAANVIDGLFGVTQELYGLEYREITETAVEQGYTMWHSDARLFEVWDKQTNELLGEFYLDLYPRANKYNHAAQFSLLSRKRYPDGTLQKPLVALVCNFSQPTAGRPALLSHSEVRTFFHEFGHCLHSILTQAETTQFSGTRVARDFVEAPSQMFENWVWDADVLNRFAKHYETEELLPDEMLAGMLAARNLGSGMSNQGQVFLGSLDLSFHTASGGEVDTTTVSNEIFERETLYRTLPETYFHASFGHLVGYQAGYYGYLWSKVFAQDMFGRFKRLGMLNSEAGAYYRKKILAPGGMREASELLLDYLGRKPDSNAFLEHLGLETAGASN
ncbi:MAG: thimet oligopeptidase [Planctomycetota bacterium]|jgi:thimet oligopeptidase